MSVTITSSANEALSSDLLFSGTLTISDALSDGTETLAVTVYNKDTGGTFTGTAQTYSKANTLTYSYANGSSVSVNLSNGNWVYQRTTDEVGNSTNTYIITFTWNDADGVKTNVLSIEVKQNVTVNKFTSNTLDDLDASITGTFDVSIVKASGIAITPTLVVNTTTMAGTSKSITSASGSYSWTFLDDSALTLDLGAKTFTYTRATSDVGNQQADSYNFSIAIGGAIAQLGVLSVVGFAPTIRSFYGRTASDTDVTITGGFSAGNTTGATISMSVTHNGMLYTGDVVTFADTMQWSYSDGTKLTIDASKNTWTYTRDTESATDLLADTYVFEVKMSSRYGNTSNNVTVVTQVPKADITSFVADNINDDANYITGSLVYTLPSIAKSPKMSVGVTVNGVAYTSTEKDITGQSLSFEFSNNSKFVMNPTAGTFTYTRSTDDIGNSEADTYVFNVTITVNGATITQSANTQSMAGQRVYDYEPAYPVNISPGSLEKQNTAWPKYTMEIQRIYRQFNDNLNYYESLAVDLKSQIADFKTYFDNMMSQFNSKLAAALAKVNSIGFKAITGVAYHGQTIPVPSGSSRSNCVCLVSLNRWTNTNSDNKYTYDMYIWVDSNWVLTCYTVTHGRDGTGGTYPGYANYLVIDTSTHS
jgi:hypothetical protein